jgi:two-component system, LytTR family, response regulator
MTLRTVVADDEPIGRARLLRLLEDDPRLEVAAACADGVEAVAAIREHRPDLVFLDIQMPRLNGFEVVTALAEDARPPAVVFVTAHHEYAVKAFQVEAIDYLLKPVDPDRLDAAIERALRRESDIPQNPEARILSLLQELALRNPGRLRDRVVIRTPERTVFLRSDTIDWVEAAGKFVQLHVGKTVHSVRQSMAELEHQLDPTRFLRISRFTIVNLDRVQEIQPWFQGDYVLILADGTRLTSTRGYREVMRRLIGKSA